MTTANDPIRHTLHMRLDKLRKMSFAELSALPEETIEDVGADGTRIRVTILRSLTSNGGVKIVIRSDRKLIGPFWKGMSEGFAMASDGTLDHNYTSTGFGL